MTPAIDKPVKAKPDRRPRRQLLESIAVWRESADTLRRERDEAREESKRIGTRLNAVAEDNKALEKRIESSRTDFADLKARLLAAELANAEMRGYVLRLQEDDVVREELVTTGDPNGERQMVPKRKHHTFGAPSQMTAERPRHDFEERMSSYRGGDEPRRPRCWVSY